MKVIGLMSGTSADGIDVALCEINGTPPDLKAQILAASVRPYEADFQRHILDACLPHKSSVDVICQINVALAEAFADAANKIIHEAGLKPQDVALIGSHGQTLWHQVQPDGRVSATLQVGESAVIAERTGITTISNFRARDVAVGGQGAPLTAYVDWLLLRHPVKWRAVQNIGGIGNVTFLPPLADQSNQPIAFDTGPGNALIDASVNLLFDQPYDANGQIASLGQVDPDWLATLMQHPYYQRSLPKTTGRELFGVMMAQELVRDGRAVGLSDEDIVTTLTTLTAASIRDAYRRFAPMPIEQVIIGGGGARNPVLMSVLRSMLSPAEVLTHESIGLDSDYKEALVFAVLAYETWYARAGTLPALTGGEYPVVLGQITPGANYIDLIRKTWV